MTRAATAFSVSELCVVLVGVDGVIGPAEVDGSIKYASILAPYQSDPICP